MFAYHCQRLDFRWPSQQQYRILETQKRIDYLRERAGRPASLCIRRTRMYCYRWVKKAEAIAALPVWRYVIGQHILDAQRLQTNGPRHKIGNMHVADFNRDFGRYKDIFDTHVVRIEGHFTAYINIPVDQAIGLLNDCSRLIIVNTRWPC